MLYNPTPGLDFRGADLVRNLILACYMGRPLAEQEVIYRKHWSFPFEQQLGSGMDDMLQAFLNQHLEP